MIVVQQVDHFLERHLARQFVDVVTAINQLANVALDITEPGGGGNHAFKTFGGSN